MNKGFNISDTIMQDFRLALIHDFWNAQEVVNDKTMVNDYRDLMKLPQAEQTYILHIHAFFGRGDEDVIDFICEHIMSQAREINASWYFYEIIKSANENVHSETYARLLDYLAPNNKEKLLNAVGEYSFVRRKIEWCKKFMGRDIDRSVLCLMIVEQLFFSSSFCGIFWYKNVREILKGVSLANEMISRDEGLHYRAGLHVYKSLPKSMTEREVVAFVREAVEIEQEFVNIITPDTVGMSKKLMCQYVEFMADNIIADIGFPRIYNSANPFGFMAQFGIEKKVDNFHRKNTGYTAFVMEPYNPIKMIFNTIPLTREQVRENKGIADKELPLFTKEDVSLGSVLDNHLN